MKNTKLAIVILLAALGSPASAAEITHAFLTSVGGHTVKCDCGFGITYDSNYASAVQVITRLWKTGVLQDSDDGATVLRPVLPIVTNYAVIVLEAAERACTFYSSDNKVTFTHDDDTTKTEIALDLLRTKGICP